MESKASSRYLTHSYASFYGCTLNEVFMIILGYVIAELPLLLLLSALLAPTLGGFFGAFLLILITFYLITHFILVKQTARFLGYIRQGKPPGYLQHKIYYLLHQYCGKRIPYVIRKGNWITRRHINVRSYQK